MRSIRSSDACKLCLLRWGNRQERLETPVKNYRDCLTYYGAINCLTGEMTLRSYSKANTKSTIELIKELQSQEPKAKIVLIWDGASHHRSQEFRDFHSEGKSRRKLECSLSPFCEAARCGCSARCPKGIPLRI